MTELTTIDVVVVGCGSAGLSAAVAAKEAHPDARIVVLERARREERGGNTAWTKAFFRLHEDGTPTDDFASRIIDYSLGQADAEIVEHLTDGAAASVAWLREHGVEMAADKTYFLTSHGTRLMPRGGGRAIVDRLAASFESSGGEIVYNAEVSHLITDGEDVAGVAGTLDGVAHEWRAGTVILGTGGFQGDASMLAEHLGERGRSLTPICHGGRYDRGEGIRMALGAGAAPAGQFDMFHGEPADPRATKSEALVMVYPYGILVNEHARRFLDEGRDTPDETFEDVAYHIWRDANQTSFLIVDQRLLTADWRPGVLSETEPIMADSIEELAELLGLDSDALRATVDEYNAAAQPGELDVSRLDGVATTGLRVKKSNWARPIDRGPYGAWPISAVITFTFGGVRTDTTGRALHEDGTPVPGLFVVGEAAGLYHHSYPGASSVLRAVTFGIRAGQAAGIPAPARS